MSTAASGIGIETAGSQPLLGVDARAYGVPEALASDITLLDRLLGEVLAPEHDGAINTLAQQLYQESLKSDGDADLGRVPGDDIFDRYPALRDPAIMRKLLRAYTIFFQMVNTVEQKEIVRANRQRQAQQGKDRPESIAEAISKLKEQGKTADDVQRLLDRIEICPTITAHPTEARRRSVLDKLMSITSALSERGLQGDAPRLDRPLDTPLHLSERELLCDLTELWHTDELRTSRVAVADEVNNSVYFFQHTILEVIAWLHDDLRAALGRFYPGHEFHVPPFLRYHSWVGGDRDGNPNVTPEITWDTCLYHKRVILGHYLTRIDTLRRELSLSSRLISVGQALTESLERDSEIVSLSAVESERFANQPYARKLTFMEQRLRATLKHIDNLSGLRGESVDFAARPPAYSSAEEFVSDLQIIEDSLAQSQASLLAKEGSLPRLLVQARTFGFCLATLDVRQHSREHARVLDEIFAAAGILPPSGVPYSEMPEDEKVALLARELRSPRPLLPRDWEGSARTRVTLEVFQVIRNARRYISEKSVTCYVISMTHQVSDMLEVLVLAKEAGLVRWRPALTPSNDTPAIETQPGELVLESDLDIVPLFETIEDLQSCDGMLRQLFADDTFRLHLAARGNFQELMLGYSDSSKDGGYLAANWNLQDTQDRLADACIEAGIDFRLFHGRGGTVGRGGGRASRAILSQPKGSFTGRIRFTEQGEVVSFRYGLRPMAHRHLEQIVNSVLIALADSDTSKRGDRNHDRFGSAMNSMASHSREVYRAMVHEDPEFWDFYTRATPIAHISRLPITSRPASRGGGRLSGLDELRAIPWVFAWVQCRYVVPGWYGLGSALERYASQSPSHLEELREMYRDWPFFKTVVDNAQLELVRTHLPTAALYSSRVSPAALGQRFHKIITDEFDKSRRWVLEVTGQKVLLENAPVVQRTVRLRNPAVLPLNRLQVALMEQWDAQDDKSHENPWYEAMLLSITGIAAGMQSTG